MAVQGHNNKRLIEFPNQGSQPNIHSFWAGVAITCGCGKNPDPIIVHFLPGVPLKAFCGVCRTEFVLARISFDFQAQKDPLNVAVAAMEPTIVTPM